MNVNHTDEMMSNKALKSDQVNQDHDSMTRKVLVPVLVDGMVI